ncbi:MAG TPA: hypothetical protein VK638_49510 [Edaphobacter sp.]|nr:hypothetical protein [Edaphobacter sp.]
MKMTQRNTKRIAVVFGIMCVVFVQLASGQNLPPAGALPAEIERRLEAQQQQINDLRRLVETQQRLLEKALSAATAVPAPVPTAVPAPVPTAVPAPVPAPVVTAAVVPFFPDSAPIKAPLSLEIGGTSITPIGFLDFMQVWRSGVVPSGVPTNFAEIPFRNTVFGARRQTISSAANSRMGVQINTKAFGTNVLGVVETDFLGFQPGNVTTTANAYGMRLRLAFADLQRGKWEILAGQAWSLLTPGRKGISPLPGNLFLTQDLDPNIQSGLVWARTPQFRAIYHPSATVAMGVSFESGDAYAGGSAGAGAITLPAAFSPDYFRQLNTGSGGLAVPNPNSDFITKIAFDPKISDRSVHLEVGGLINRFTFFNPLVSRSFSTVGGGVAFNAGFEVLKNLSLFTNNFYSNGGGRFIFGEGPSLIIRADGSPSLVQAMSTVNGLEYQVNAKLKVFSYYGATYLGRNVTIDPSTGKQVGYGYTGSPNSQNRTIQQVTGGFTRVFWKNPNYGAFQFSGQYSWVDRHPWYGAPDQPNSADLNSLHLGLRYVLPGSPPVK